MKSDAELLAAYAGANSEEAFGEVVRRHVDRVYSVAAHRVGGDAHLAEDVTQRVFIDLARKAATLAHHPALCGWLHRSAHYAATDLVRAEQRRRNREQKAQAMHETLAEPTTWMDWEKIRPLLDQTIAELDEDDRNAVALRFFEGLSFPQIGRALHLTDDAARKRVDRALDRLQLGLRRGGITSTAAALSLTLSQSAGAAAPAGLAIRVISSALSNVAVSTGVGVIAATFLKAVATSKSALVFAGVAVGLGLGLAYRETDSALRARRGLENAKFNYDASLAALEQAKAQNIAAAKSWRQRQQPVPLTMEERIERDFELTFAKARKDPQILALTRAMNQRRARQSYGALFSSLGLSSMQIDTFASIYAGFFAPKAGNSFALQMKEKTSAIVMPSEEEKMQGNALLQELLGEAGFSKYSSYEQMRPLREEIVSFAARINDVEPLDSATAEKLLKIYTDNQSFRADVSDRSEFYRHVLDEAKPVLSADQLVGLQAFATMRSGVNFINSEASLAGDHLAPTSN